VGGLRVAVGPEPYPAVLAETVSVQGARLVPPGDAEVLVWVRHDGVGFREFLATAPSVRWVQLPSAGIDWLFELDLHRPDITWACAKGAFGDSVAELAIGLLVAGFRDVHTFARASSWLPESGRPLGGSHVAILGGGGIAVSVLERLAGWRVETTVVSRRAVTLAGADRVVAMDELPKVLDAADAAVVALPLVPATRNLLGAEELRRLGPDGWLVNVGRGGLVDTAALVEALTAGRLGGAALDVVEPEPLPAGHALWSLPNVLLTPHVAATADMSVAPFAARLAENLRRWALGEPLLGLVDAGAGY
jgi:phosphoglycerate dehydrogenase-like enzyme